MMASQGGPGWAMTDWPPTWHVDSQMWVNSRVEPGRGLLWWAKPVDLGNFHTNVPDEDFEGNTPEEAHGFYTYVPAQGSWNSSGHVRVWHDPDNARWRSSSQTPHDQGHGGLGGGMTLDKAGVSLYKKG